MLTYQEKASVTPFSEKGAVPERPFYQDFLGMVKDGEVTKTQVPTIETHS